MPSLKEIRNNKTLAYVLPFVVFMAFLSLDAVLSATGFKIENEYAGAWYRYYTEQWIYPLQSFVCFAVILFFWKQYEFRPIKGWGLGVVVGVVGIILWILPAVLYVPLGVKDWPSFELSVPLILDNKPIWSIFGLAERPDGFDATWFRDEHPALVRLRNFHAIFSGWWSSWHWSRRSSGAGSCCVTSSIWRSHSGRSLLAPTRPVRSGS